MHFRDEQTMSLSTTFLKALVSTSLALPMFAAQATTIDFDGTGAPTLFADTTQLTTLYSGLGIIFSGLDSPIGGSILNQDGNFGFQARSGTDFLGFNTAITGAAEKIEFTSAVSSVSIWAASRNTGIFSLAAFGGSGQFLGFTNVVASTAWQELTISAPGIKSVALSGFSGSFAYDDLHVTAVPEPETYAMMLAGLGVLGFMGKRRKTQ